MSVISRYMVKVTDPSIDLSIAFTSPAAVPYGDNSICSISVAEVSV